MLRAQPRPLWTKLLTRPRRLGVLSYVGTQLILLFWWIAFWPGLVSYDSVMYVWQVSTGNWTTQHSTVYNGLLWLSLRATGEYATLTLLQTVALAAGLAYAVTGLRRLRVPGRWLAVAAMIAVALPAVGTFAVYVSKDVPFAICEVWLLGTVARMLAVRPRIDNRLLWTLFAELSLIALFRQNGFVVIAVTGLGLVVLLSGQRARLAAATAAAIAVGAVANLLLFPALGVKPAGSELILGPAYADLAVAYQQRPAVFRASDRALLATVAPLSYWRTTANCYDADETVTTDDRKQFSVDAARAHQAELFGLWVRLLEHAPDIMIQARLCRGSIAWNPLPGPPSGRTVKIPISGLATYFDFKPARIAQSPYAGALRYAPLDGTAHNLAVFARRLSDTPAFEWLAWRGATWSYVAYLAVGLLARRRRDRTLLALVAVIAATQLNVAVNNPNQLVRYMEGPLILGILLLPLAFVRERS